MAELLQANLIHRKMGGGGFCMVFYPSFRQNMGCLSDGTVHHKSRQNEEIRSRFFRLRPHSALLFLYMKCRNCTVLWGIRIRFFFVNDVNLGPRTF